MDKLQLSKKVFGLTWLAMLIALQVIVGRFHVGPSFLKIGFGFIVTALIGYYFGPIKSIGAGFISDILANVLFPPQGGFFWGFTLSAMVTGFIYGQLLYQKQITWQRLLVVNIVVILVVNLLLNTIWVCVLGKLPFLQMLLLRGVKELIFIPIQTIMLWLVFRWLKQHSFLE
ncbi:folate family ECF transporter S component [Bombilactobacillus folatiphilus]|uniref:Folate family ECF transporter S component n=1 Tax=Bombilactobacillus folatiphilus TaxID=2923362 RepID=A0ABY4PA80_9LACO|nr:folate family ECF transporter S component [Bombilactobacillus folatiphilus]UQS82431.1 folate family ECF transporter S component [Bombilactobacillus folatiphilus]